jgi:DeoR/GlpR family transcriptional regulator of sugar metabolism
LLERTYGGAVASFLNSEPGIKERALSNPEGRRQMARRAVELLSDSGIIMIDTGATTAHICERLAAEVPRSGRVELTAITNSLRNVGILGANPSIRVMVCPGNYDDREDAVFGTQTIEFVSRFNADVVVMSAGGVTANVVTDANSEAAAVKRAMLRQSARSMLVIERHKFELPQFEKVCLLDEFDVLVTDEPVSRDLIASLSSDKVHVASGA